MSIRDLSRADIIAIASAPMDQRMAVCKRYKIFSESFYNIKNNPIKYLKRFWKLNEPCDLCSETYHKIYGSLKLCSDHYDRATAQMLGLGTRKYRDYLIPR